MLVKNPLEPHPWDHLPEWDWSARLARILMIELSDVYEYFGGLGWELLEVSATKQFWARPPRGGDRVGIEISGLRDSECQPGQTYLSLGHLKLRQKQPHEVDVSLEALITIPVSRELVDELDAIEAAFHLLHRKSREAGPQSEVGP